MRQRTQDVEGCSIVLARSVVVLVEQYLAAAHMSTCSNFGHCCRVASEWERVEAIWKKERSRAVVRTTVDELLVSEPDEWMRALP